MYISIVCFAYFFVLSTFVANKRYMHTDRVERGERVVGGRQECLTDSGVVNIVTRRSQQRCHLHHRAQQSIQLNAHTLFYIVYNPANWLQVIIKSLRACTQLLHLFEISSARRIYAEYEKNKD